jgi:1-acyl-sn-glycerol-3-phosphate acyltransferase
MIIEFFYEHFAIFFIFTLFAFSTAVKVTFLSYIANFYLFLYKIINYKKRQKLGVNEFWKKPLRHVALAYDLLGRIMHDYEIDLDKIPDKGPALIILYHGITPIDLIFLHSRIFIKKNRQVFTVVDRLLIKAPGLQTFVEALEAIADSRDNCISKLSKGELVAVYPGGTRESLFSGKNYDLLWANRTGFAKTAIKAKAPIIPVFTMNSRETSWQIKLGEKYIRELYEKKRIMIFFVYFWFPVKLKTFVGEPIEYREDRSLEDLIKIVRFRL